MRSNQHLQRAIHKYGAESFTFERIISILDPAALTEYEDFEIKSVQKELRYNTRENADNNFGAKASAETIAKMATSMREKFRNPEYRARHLARQRALTNDSEWMKNNATANRARAQDPEWNAKCHAAANAKAKDAAWLARVAAEGRNPNVEAARFTRQMVRVTTDSAPSDHKSVRVAFEDHGLPVESHQRFRLRLKASGRETFIHEGKEYVFELV